MELGWILDADVVLVTDCGVLMLMLMLMDARKTFSALFTQPLRPSHSHSRSAGAGARGREGAEVAGARRWYLRGVNFPWRGRWRWRWRWRPAARP